ncbi:hypothetical protein BH10BAC5_BH10BAC5_18110 [soil metagenome]
MKLRKVITTIFITLVMNISVLPVSFIGFKEERSVIYNFEENDEFLKRNRKKRISILMSLYYKILLIDRKYDN